MQSRWEMRYLKRIKIRHCKSQRIGGEVALADRAAPEVDDELTVGHWDRRRDRLDRL